MDALELLYDHYKESFGLVKEAQARRNRSFILLCVLEALSFLILVRPEKAYELILNGINKELDTALQLSSTIIQTLLWLLISYIMIRYVQDMLYVERQYSYLSQLEREISDAIKINVFTREGDHYLKNYPMVLNFIDLFYKMLMPEFFCVINVVRIWKEWILANNVTVALICDTILSIAIFIITWFYFFEIHSKITAFFKKYVPIIDKIARAIRSLLKEV